MALAANEKDDARQVSTGRPQRDTAGQHPRDGQCRRGEEAMPSEGSSSSTTKLAGHLQSPPPAAPVLS